MTSKSSPEKKAFYSAIVHGRIDDVKDMLDKRPYLINTANNCGHNPLMMSCIFYNVKMLEYLIEVNLKAVNEQDMFGNTILVIAPHYLVNYFIKMGSDYHIKNHKGLNMLEQLIYDEKSDHIKALYYTYLEGNVIITENFIDFRKIAKHRNRNNVEFEIKVLKDFWRTTVGTPKKKRIYPPHYRGMPPLVDRFQ